MFLLFQWFVNIGRITLFIENTQVTCLLTLIFFLSFFFKKEEEWEVERYKEDAGEERNKN